MNKYLLLFPFVLVSPCFGFTTDDEAMILEKINYFGNCADWFFFLVCSIWGTLLYIAFMQKR